MKNLLVLCVFLNALVWVRSRHAHDTKHKEKFRDDEVDKENDIHLGNGYFMGMRFFDELFDDLDVHENKGEGEGEKKCGQPKEQRTKEQRKKERKAQEEWEKKNPKEAEEKRQKKLEEERKEEFTTADGDYLEHDCLTIKEYTYENFMCEPWNKGLSRKKFKNFKDDSEKKYVKYSHAYGIPMIGTAKFSDESMKRGCYLIRYIMADNMQMRIEARRRRMFNVGYNGRWCCPPQMSNNGLSCPCDMNFPSLGKDTPAHEMGHYFIHLLIRMSKEGLFKLPEYVDPENLWKYQKPFAMVTKRKKTCTNASVANQVEKKGEFYTWVWNSRQQDRMKGTTVFASACSTQHYIMYSGQNYYLFQGTQSMMDGSRECFKKKSPNLINLMKKIWPCDNYYIPVCKDAAYGFLLGAAQTFTIGKADPKDPANMICKKDLDKPQILVKDLPEMEKPTEDLGSKIKCAKIARKVDPDLGMQIEEGKSVPRNAFARYLKNNREEAWWLRRCCAKIANWDNSIPNNGNVESPKSPLPFAFEGEEEETDTDVDVCNGSWMSEEEELGELGEEEELEEGYNELSEDNDDEGEYEE